jgi:hypothetical protein
LGFALIVAVVALVIDTRAKQAQLDRAKKELGFGGLRSMGMEPLPTQGRLADFSYSRLGAPRSDRSTYDNRDAVYIQRVEAIYESTSVCIHGEATLEEQEHQPVGPTARVVLGVNPVQSGRG